VFDGVLDGEDTSLALGLITDVAVLLFNTNEYVLKEIQISLFVEKEKQNHLKLLIFLHMYATSFTNTDNMTFWS